MKTTSSRLAHRLNRWLHESESEPRLTEHPMPQPEHEKHGPPPKELAPHPMPPPREPHDQPWIPTGGLVGRKRRNERKAQ